MKTNFAPETAQLLCEYMSSTSRKKRRLRKKITTIEIKKIRATIQNNLDSILEKLYKSENSRIYINTADYLISSKKFSHGAFTRTIDPRSLKNNIERYKYIKLLKMASNEQAKDIHVARKLKKLSIKERAFIAHITGANLEVFNIIN